MVGEEPFIYGGRLSNISTIKDTEKWEGSENLGYNTFVSTVMCIV